MSQSFEAASPSGSRRLPVRPAAPFAPNVPSQVGKTLLAYFHRQAGMEALQYAEGPELIPNGWETYTYHFRLADSSTLPSPYNRPLILRVYSSPQGLPRARHEFAVQRHLHGLGYPVAEPLFLEESCTWFGGLFAVMERVPGQTFLDHLHANPLRLWDSPWELAALHARLHALPSEGFPAPEGPFLERRLEEMRCLMRDHDLRKLQAGWRWLADHRPAPPAVPSILHLDYHPLNVMRGPDGSLAVLDWTEADVGDRHADVATTLMLIRCCPDQPGCGWRLLEPVGRFLLWRRYWRGYKKWARLDRAKLSYYGALAALRRLCGYGRWLRTSPLATGCKASSIKHLRPAHLQGFRDYFRARSGVDVGL
jgi:aminoglycoside phosphotransferase (APT) family kinase protein